MKLLTLNFLTCAVRSCKTSPAAFPLHPRDAELESVELAFSPAFLRGVLPRLEWGAMGAVCGELGLRLPVRFEGAAENAGAEQTGGSNHAADVDAGAQPERMEGVVQQEEGENTAATDLDLESVTDEQLRELHGTLIETQMMSGKLVCGNCGHEYAVKEGIANFLLPAHLV